MLAAAVAAARCFCVTRLDGHACAVEALAKQHALAAQAVVGRCKLQLRAGRAAHDRTGRQQRAAHFSCWDARRAGDRPAARLLLLLTPQPHGRRRCCATASEQHDAPLTARRRGPGAACRSCRGRGSCQSTCPRGRPRLQAIRARHTRRMSAAAASPAGAAPAAAAAAQGCLLPALAAGKLHSARTHPLRAAQRRRRAHPPTSAAQPPGCAAAGLCARSWPPCPAH